MKETIIVTGKTGFIGRNLIKCINLKKYNLVTPSREDYYKLSEIKKIDRVIHIAGHGTTKNKELYKISNIDLTKEIVELAKTKKTKKIIFISTYVVDYAKISEYGKSKKISEDIIKNSGIDYTIIRPTVVYGKDDNKNINKLIKLIYKNKFIPIIGDGKYLIQPTYIEDLIDLILKSINNFKNETVYIGSKEVICYNKFVDLISNSLNKKIIKIHIPKKIIKPIIYLQEKILKNPAITTEQLGYLDKVKPINLNRKLKLTPIRETIKETVSYLKAKQKQKKYHS